MPLKIGRTGPFLPDLVRDLASGLRLAVDQGVLVKSMLSVSLTIRAQPVHATYRLTEIAVEQVDANAEVPNLANAWIACFAGQGAGVIADWVATRAAAVNLMAGIWTVLPRAADGSVLRYMPSGDMPLTITVSAGQRTAYNNLIDTLVATVG